jgi:hypothetical protein
MFRFKCLIDALTALSEEGITLPDTDKQKCKRNISSNFILDFPPLFSTSISTSVLCSFFLKRNVVCILFQSFLLLVLTTPDFYFKTSPHPSGLHYLTAAPTMAKRGQAKSPRLSAPTDDMRSEDPISQPSVSQLTSSLGLLFCAPPAPF